MIASRVSMQYLIQEGRLTGFQAALEAQVSTSSHESEVGLESESGLEPEVVLESEVELEPELGFESEVVLEPDWLTVLQEADIAKAELDDCAEFVVEFLCERVACLLRDNGFGSRKCMSSRSEGRKRSLP
jgi:hypothetical protein